MINYFQIYSGACSFFGGGKDIFTYIIQNVQLKKQNAALSSIFVTIYIYEKKTYIFSLKDENNTTVNVEASTSSGRDDIWSNFHDYTVQPKVPDAASPDNFSNADPVDQTEDAAVPGNRATVTQGTNTCEQINYEEKYRKAPRSGCSARTGITSFQSRTPTSRL